MAWNLTGSYVETCSCELMCPCNLSLDHGATYDFCRVTLVFDIREGEIEGTDIAGRKVAGDVYAMVVPGSVQVKAQAEREGLDEVFRAAGFDWRGAGCSMCLGMNPDILQPGERCASTSNRNFEGRQGRGARTHLVSPEMAAAAAIEGHFVDIREWK